MTETPITDDINQPKYSDIRKEAAAEFLAKELKLHPPTIISTKMSQSSPIMWIELQDSDTADMLMRQSAKIRNRDGIAIMYPPQELFPTIKSIENKCKARRTTHPNLRYQVRLGHENVELCIKI